MYENSLEYKDTSLNSPYDYVFESIPNSKNDVYRELNEIAEELERCRLRNC